MKSNQATGGFRKSLHGLIGRNVVLDTQGTILYLGRLADIDETGFRLVDADVHDCTEGHAGKELYVIEAAHYGIRVNRKEVFVFRSSVLSMSAMDDIVTELTSDRDLWSPPADSV